MKRLFFLFLAFPLSLSAADASLQDVYEAILSNTSTLDLALQSVQYAVNQCNGQLDGLSTANSHLSAIEVDVDTARIYLQNINNALNSANGYLNTINGNILSVGDDTDVIRSNSGNILSSIGTLTDYVLLLHGDMQTLNSSVSLLCGITNTLSSISAGVSSMSLQLSGMETHLGNLDTNIQSLSEIALAIFYNTQYMRDALIAINQRLQRELLVTLGPTNLLTFQRINKRHRIWANDSTVDNLSLNESDVFWRDSVGRGGYLSSAYQHIAFGHEELKQIRKSSIIAALNSAWITNHLGSVHTPLVSDIAGASLAATNYLYARQYPMLEALTNLLGVVVSNTYSNVSEQRRAEEQANQYKDDVTSEIQSVDYNSNESAFDNSTNISAPSFGDDNTSSLTDLRETVRSDSDRVARMVQSAQSGMFLGVTLPGYSYNDVTVLRGDEAFGFDVSSSANNGVYTFLTALRSVFIFLYSLLSVFLALKAWRLLVHLWDRVTSLFGEKVTPSMMI